MVGERKQEVKEGSMVSGFTMAAANIQIPEHKQG